MKYGILINPKKTQLFQSHVVFLGYKITAEGIQPTDKYLDAIRTWPLPTTPKELAKFLGFVQYYNSLIPNFSALTANIHPLKNKKKLVWDKQ